MPVLLERPKMTKTMYQALKKHIIKEREKKKQAEEEQDALLERQRKEREMRKKKEEEDSLTLEQTKEQIHQLEKKLESLKAEKHELFSQLKKVLNQEEESRKRAQLKEQGEMLSLQQSYQHPSIPVSGHAMLLQQPGRPTLYRPTQPHLIPNVALKRPRSPSPPPSTLYQHQYGDPKLIPATLAVPKQQTGSLYTHPQGDFKTGNFQQAQSSQVAYVSQPGHSYQQPSATYTTSKSPASKYNTPSQSAFSSYASHYAQHQKAMSESPFQNFSMQRVQQPAYLGSPHASSIPLQQQLEHANQKAGFTTEDNYKMQQQQQQQQQIRGVTPLAGQQTSLISAHPQLQLQQSQPKGSIVTGYSGRSPAQQGPPTSSYQPSSSQANYPGQQPGTPGRPGYTQQQQGRYY
ncbi:hypothetical protein CHS0354_032410 [Potamilus streckersoni]|uniref:G protein pathway suppressor 2 n=1 Tax=Potamilus streckersoni TaxID=2493646 RepID=A0AAE0RXS4_9BIVA|nr:hypothetical protein CHS0354_032410 [Potamilus streckersoni]